MSALPRTDADDAEVTWASGWPVAEPAKVVDVLCYAYSTHDEVRRIAVSAGLAWDEVPDEASLRTVWTRLLRAAVARDLILDVMATVLHDEAGSEFRAVLSGLLGKHLGHVNALLVRRYGPPPPAGDGQDPVLESIVAAEPVTEGPHRGELEAITSLTADMPLASATLKALRDVAVRTALIEIEGRPMGTGFLVGANLLLTAAHVLDKRNSPPNPFRAMEAVFDFDGSDGRSYAESGTRLKIKEFVTGSLPTAAEADGVVGPDWDAPEDRLDFALLKLATPVPEPRGTGDARGYYRLDPTDYNFQASDLYVVVQHPQGDFARAAILKKSPQRSPSGTRIRYGGATLPGSSGSPIADFRGRLVGIHHYGNPSTNQGIPISVIARQLLGGPYASLFDDGAPAAPSAAVTVVDPFTTHAVLRRRPFVDRHNLRATMRDMAESPDSPRTLAITGLSRSGVSYSYRLAAHVAQHSTLCPSLAAVAPGGLRAVKVDLRDYLTLGVERARTEIGIRLLLDLGVIEAPTDPLAQGAREIVTLVDTIGARLKRSTDVQWWFFFDSVDNLQTIKQGQVDELIHALIELADDVQVPLRIVVAGREAVEFARLHTGGWAERDDALGLTLGEVEAWLRERAREERREIDEALLSGKLAELFPPGPLPDPENVALRLPTALLEVLAP